MSLPKELSMSRLLVVFALVAALAAVGVASASAADPLGHRKVCTKFAYVDARPGSTLIGTLFRHETFVVHRYSRSHRFAYGLARGNVHKRGWVRAAQLCG
jgi:hypothetical protein